MNLRPETLSKIKRALHKAGHWYIVGVYNWMHPLNTVPNCVTIAFDGFVQCKFRTLNNGRLQLMEVRSEAFLPISKVVNVGRSISVKDLCKADLTRR